MAMFVFSKYTFWENFVQNIEFFLIMCNCKSVIDYVG